MSKRNRQEFVTERYTYPTWQDIKHIIENCCKAKVTYNSCCVLFQGIDVFDPKFNIVSPGADADVYFPFTEADRRLKRYHPELKELLFGAPQPGKYVGQLKDPDKPIIFR